MSKINIFYSKKYILLTLFLILIITVGCISQNNKQKHNKIYNIDHTIDCLDKNGLSFKYKLKYNIISKENLDYNEINEIRKNIMWIVREVVDPYMLIDECILKRDSIECIITNEVLEKSKTEKTSIDSFSIEEISVPDFIYEYIFEKHGEIENVKVYE